MTYRKFGWPSQAQFYTDMEAAGYKSGDLFFGCAIKELDPICLTKDAEGVCTQYDTRHFVDIVFYTSVPTQFEQYIVWPEPVGIHIFAELDWMYARDFCEFNPTSPYCAIPQE